MNDVMTNIITRRSVRKYLDKKVEMQILDEIISAGLYAPSARNVQPWQFTVIQDVDKLEELRAAIAKALDRPDYNRFYNAPLFIIVTVPEDYRFGDSDTSCVLENMFLAAHSYGVGSVWINQLRDCCNDPEVRKLLTSYGIPESHVCYGCGAFGYADGEVSPDRVNKGVVKYAD